MTASAAKRSSTLVDRAAAPGRKQPLSFWYTRALPPNLNTHVRLQCSLLLTSVQFSSENDMQAGQGKNYTHTEDRSAKRVVKELAD